MSFSRISRVPSFLFLSLVAFLSHSAKADTFNISWDNDLLLGLDEGYTNGIRLSYLSAPASDSKSRSAAAARHTAEELAALPQIKSPGKDQALSLSLRQLMITPEDISREQPSFNDLPYAGYLSVSSTLWSWDTSIITGYGAHLGVVGPESGAEATQKWVHKLTGSEEPQGWDHQLGTDVVGGVQATHARKFWESGQNEELEQQLAWVSSAMLSSFRSHGRIGSVWRLGENLPINFIPDYAGTSSAIGMPSAINGAGHGWSIFLGLGLEYVAYSYLEDNAEPYQFEQSPLLLQAGLGATWQWQNLQTAFILRATTGEEQSNKDDFSFGTISFTWSY